MYKLKLNYIGYFIQYFSLSRKNILSDKKFISIIHLLVAFSQDVDM